MLWLFGCIPHQEPVIDPPFGKLYIEGDSINYEVSGYGSVFNNPVILVIPGGPGLGYGYLKKALSDILKAHFQLLFYDQRGAGHSSLNDSTKLTMDVFVDDLEQIRKRTNQEKLVLLGHSFGGLLAMQYAIMYPERVDRLILVESDPASYHEWVRFREILGNRMTKEDSTEILELQKIPCWDQSPQVFENHMLVFLRSYLANRDLSGKLRLNFDSSVLINYKTVYPAIRRDLGRYDIHEELKRLSMPVLLLYGQESIFPEETIRSLYKSFSNGELEYIEGAGHFPYLENPKLFFDEVETFMNKNGKESTD